MTVTKYSQYAIVFSTLTTGVRLGGSIPTMNRSANARVWVLCCMNPHSLSRIWLNSCDLGKSALAVAPMCHHCCQVAKPRSNGLLFGCASDLPAAVALAAKICRAPTDAAFLRTKLDRGFRLKLVCSTDWGLTRFAIRACCSYRQDSDTETISGDRMSEVFINPLDLFWTVAISRRSIALTHAQRKLQLVSLENNSENNAVPYSCRKHSRLPRLHFCTCAIHEQA